MTSAFLLARFALGLLAGFLARSAFFSRLAFLAAVCLRFTSGALVSRVFSASLVFVLVGFSWTGLRSSHPSPRLGEIATRIFGD